MVLWQWIIKIHRKDKTSQYTGAVYQPITSTDQGSNSTCFSSAISPMNYKWLDESLELRLAISPKTNLWMLLQSSSMRKPVFLNVDLISRPSWVVLRVMNAAEGSELRAAWSQLLQVQRVGCQISPVHQHAWDHRSSQAGTGHLLHRTFDIRTRRGGRFPATCLHRETNLIQVWTSTTVVAYTCITCITCITWSLSTRPQTSTYTQLILYLSSAMNCIGQTITSSDSHCGRRMYLYILWLVWKGFMGYFVVTYTKIG